MQPRRLMCPRLDTHSCSGAVGRAARFLLQIGDATARDGTRSVPAEVARRSRSPGPAAGKETRAAQRVHVALQGTAHCSGAGGGLTSSVSPGSPAQ